MKTTLIKRILSVVLTLTLVISCLAVALPNTQAADNIEFLMDGDKRVGIKGITIDGVAGLAKPSAIQTDSSVISLSSLPGSSLKILLLMFSSRSHTIISMK